MKELNDKINNLKEQIENIKENQYKDLFEAVSGILSDLSPIRALRSMNCAGVIPIFSMR